MQVVVIGKSLSEALIFNQLTHKGSFNNYVDKMRGEGVKKRRFLSTLRVKFIYPEKATKGFDHLGHSWGGSWQIFGFPMR